MPQTETNIRPPASGHRFGPDLSCSECGVTWEAHQKDPVPCSTDEISRDLDPADEHDVSKAGPKLSGVLDVLE